MREAQEQYIRVLNDRYAIESKGAELEQIKNFEQKEQALNAVNVANKKALDLAEKVNMAGDKSARIVSKWLKKRESILESLMNEKLTSKTLVALNKALDQSYISQETELAKLLTTKKAVKELSECDAIQQEIDCIDELINKYNPLADAVTKRNIALNEQSWLLQRGAIDETAYAKAVGLIDDEFKSATGEAKEFSKAAKEVTKQAGPMEVTWNRAIERLDNGFADMWKSFVRGSIDAMDFVKEAAYDFLAEMLHAFTTKKIVASFVGTFGATGAASAASGIAGSAGGSIGGVGDIFTLIKDGFMGTGMNTAITNAVNNGIQSAFGGTLNFATGTSGMLGTNIGMLGAGLVANYLGDSLFGGYGGTGASIGTAIGSAFGPVGMVAGGLLGGAVGGLFGGGSSDTTPDLNLWTRTSGNLTSPGGGVTGYGAENNGTFDPSVAYTGRFSSFSFSTQHDAFGSQADVDAFSSGLINHFSSIEDMIYATFGDEISQQIADGMVNVGRTLKFEDFAGESDFNAAFKNLFGSVFQSASKVMDDTDYYNTFRSLSGELQNVVAVTLEYAGATGELRTAYAALIKRERQNADAIVQQMGALQAVNAIFDSLNVTLYEVSLVGIDLANNFVEMAGGMEALVAKTTYFFDNFYSVEEKTALLQKQFDVLADTFDKMYGVTLPRTSSEYKEFTQALLSGGEAMQEAANAALDLGPAFVQLREIENAALQERINYVGEITSILTDRYEFELDSIQDAKDSLEDLYTTFKNIADYVDGLQLSDVSILTPSERLEESGNQFFSTLSLAKGGDIDALEKLTDVSQSYLDEARDYYASSDAYSAIWDTVNDSLESILNGSSAYTDYESSMAELQNLEISLLTQFTEDMAVLDTVIENAISGQTATLLTGMSLRNPDLIDPVDGLLDSLPQYATGSDYIQSTGLAYLHQGEAVITAQDNSQLHEEMKALREQVVILTEVVASGNQVAESQGVQQTIATKRIATNTDSRVDTRQVA